MIDAIMVVASLVTAVINLVTAILLYRLAGKPEGKCFPSPLRGLSKVYINHRGHANTDTRDLDISASYKPFGARRGHTERW